MDYTAMALVTPVVEADGAVDYLRFLQPMVERLRVVRLERLPLGTRYREVVRRVREVRRCRSSPGARWWRTRRV